jgi:uncharacterized protein (TIGR02246 family)
VPAVAAPPPLSEAEVEDFVRQYVAATNEADASRIMSMVSREPEVCSVGPGRVSQGWDAIRAATEEATASRGRFEVTLGTIEVTLLGPDAALAVAAMLVNNAAGAATIVVKRTAEGLRLIHEHYSLRPGSQTLLP